MTVQVELEALSPSLAQRGEHHRRGSHMQLGPVCPPTHVFTELKHDHKAELLIVKSRAACRCGTPLALLALGIPVLL